MGKVILNFSILLLSTATVLRGDLIAKTYSPDANPIIKRLHATKHAKLFLRGCNNESYTQLTANSTTESDFFQQLEAREYLFAIFTLNKVSVILSSSNISNVSTGNNVHKETVLFNITLGIEKNSMATLEVYVNETMIGNVTQKTVRVLPTIPYYINVTITANNISVYEARRSDVDEPFLFFNITAETKMNTFFVKFRHQSPIFAHYDCCEACHPWIYTRISGCSKYSARTDSSESITAYPLTDMISTNPMENVLFSQNIVVNHGGSPTFSAKILFTELDHLRGHRYEIGLSDAPTILHYANSTAQYTKKLDSGVTLKREYTSPFIVNITITKDGFVSLRQPYEEHPFLYYFAGLQHPILKAVDVKYMTMAKRQEDFIRYDFFWNCTDMQHVTDKHERIEDEETNLKYVQSNNQVHAHDDDNGTYPIIWEYVSKQFKTLKYDVLHVFQDSYRIYEKPSQIVDDRSDYEDPSASANMKGQSSDEAKMETTSSNGFSDTIKKAIVGAGSFLCIGILKLFFSLDCVKNLMKEVDVDDDRAKDLRKSASNVISKNMADTIGIDFND